MTALQPSIAGCYPRLGGLTIRVFDHPAAILSESSAVVLALLQFAPKPCLGQGPLPFDRTFAHFQHGR